MTEIAGTGEANNASVETMEVTSADVAVVGGPSLADLAQAASDYQVLVDNVDRAKAKVSQAEGHLAGAQEALAAAEAELAAAKEPEAPSEPEVPAQPAETEGA